MGAFTGPSITLPHVAQRGKYDAFNERSVADRVCKYSSTCPTNQYHGEVKKKMRQTGANLKRLRECTPAFLRWIGTKDTSKPWTRPHLRAKPYNRRTRKH